MSPETGNQANNASHHADQPDTKAEKKRLREIVRRAQGELTDEYIHSASAEIQRRVLAMPEYQRAKTVFCYVSAPRETGTRAILSDALQSGKRLCVPLCIAKGLMQARQITCLDELSPGAYGLLEPPKGAPLLDPSQIDLAVIPCLSCTPEGARLGKGGGFYDRFLAAYTGAKIMLCLDRLTQSAVPMDAHDQPVPVVVTEKGIFRP